MDRTFSFERGALEPGMVERLTAEYWADLAFDEAAKAALKRDGLALDGLRLTGPNPFAVVETDPDRVTLSAPGRSDAAALLDLWQVHFLRRIRETAGRKAA